jgi:3-phosphoshikimate 1-carboxyvinyltransferase
MKIEIKPGRIGGIIKAIPSKSISHRAIIAAGLAEGESRIGNVLMSDDIEATCEAMETFGATINHCGNSLDIIAKGILRQPSHPINCRESGSTLRFLTPFGGLVSEPVVFKGKEGLSKRPMKPYLDMFERQGIRCESKGGLPLVIEGKLEPGKYRLEGDVSSQFISGLLFSLPLLDGDSEIEITTPLESKGYVDLTMEILDKFGIVVEHDNYQLFRVKGKQAFKSIDMDIEGDYSQAAFWMIAGILGNGISISGLNPNSKQGDLKIIEIIQQMGAKVAFEGSNLVVNPSHTKGVVIDASQIPDLVPIITVLAALSEGKTEITNASRLRIKESDRLKSIATELNKLGAQVLEQPDGLVIFGKERLKGGVVNSWNDHRIAMSLAIASVRCEGKVIIENCEAIEKSYPDFFNDFASLGGRISE